jgi:hypothetical protein
VKGTKLPDMLAALKRADWIEALRDLPPFRG